MNKKYIVRFTKKEREELTGVVKRLKGSSQKVRRAQILLKADVRGPNWTDAKIAEAFSCRTKTVENVRQRFVELGFEDTLNHKKSPAAGAKETSRRHRRSENHCPAIGLPAGRLWQMDVAFAGTKGR